MINPASRVIAIVALCSSLCSTAYAAGPGGTISPKALKIEGGKVYITANFANPDQCANSSIVLLAASDAEELNRMTAVAMTAIASHKKIMTWLIGCAPTNWYPSVPQAVSIDLVDE